jgi:hypothetical protein
MIFAVCLLLTSSAFCTTSNVNSALDTAYDLQIESIRTQVKYEALLEAQENRIKDKEAEIKRSFWLNVVLIVALGYASGK